MANFRPNVEKALFDTLNVASLTNLATGGVFNKMAPDHAAPPYVIFNLSSKQDEHTLGTRFANSLYMVKAVSKSRWPKEAEDIDTQIDTLLENASLSISGYDLIQCRRENDIDNVELDGGESWQHIGGLYRIESGEQ